MYLAQILELQVQFTDFPKVIIYQNVTLLLCILLFPPIQLITCSHFVNCLIVTNDVDDDVLLPGKQE